MSKKKITIFHLKKWAKDLFPLNRSLTGNGNIHTLKYIKNNINSNFKIKKIPSGTPCFDWKIPKEWNVKKATLKNQDNKIISDFSRNNLELVGYSMPIKKLLSYQELQPHLHTLKKKPNAIPYVTSYYKKTWGFCLSYNKYKQLKKNIKYHVDIDSEYKKGKMSYGEFFLKGKTKKEILITSYICHPSMANNELSGLIVAALLSKIIKKNKYSLRIILIPETIGAIYFISKNLDHIKKNLVAGFNLTCVGLKGPYTIISSINKNTYADVVSERIGKKYKSFRQLSFKHRGSNERQFGCQNLNLSFVTFCRKKFGQYKEYHTSDDNLSILSYKELLNSAKFITKIINEINHNNIFIKKNFCESFLTKYNLISSLGNEKNRIGKYRRYLSNFLAYVGKNYDLQELSKIVGAKNSLIKKMANQLLKTKIIKHFF